MNTCSICYKQNDSVNLEIDPWYNENEGVEVYEYFCFDCLTALQDEVTE